MDNEQQKQSSDRCIAQLELWVKDGKLVAVLRREGHDVLEVRTQVAPDGPEGAELNQLLDEMAEELSSRGLSGVLLP